MSGSGIWASNNMCLCCHQATSKIGLQMKPCSYMLRSTIHGQWGFPSSRGSLNGASPAQVRRSPATVSEKGAHVISRKPENPPLTSNPRTFERKGQDHEDFSLVSPSTGSGMKGFSCFRIKTSPRNSQKHVFAPRSTIKNSAALVRAAVIRIMERKRNAHT